MACTFLVAPLATYLIDRFRNRFVRNLGVFFVTLSFIGASFASRIWHIFLSQSICFGLGMGLLYVGSSGITPQWFLRRRSLATGIASAGSGFGGMMYSLATGAMIPNLGLHWTFRILAILTFTGNLIASNLLRDRNKAVGSRYKAFQISMFKRPEFLLYLGWATFSVLSYVILLFSMADFSLSLGLSAHQASIVSAILNLGQCLGRPLVGLSSDRSGRINISCALSFLAGVLCLVFWIFAKSMAVVCIFAFLIGILAGTFWATSNPVLAEVVGLRDLPSGISLTYMIIVTPCAVAEVVALQLKDESSKDRAYFRVQILTGFLYIGSAACLWLLRGWKIGKIQSQRQREAARTVQVEGAKEAPDTRFDPTSPSEKDIEPVPQPSLQPLSSPKGVIKIWSPLALIRRTWAWEKV